MEGVLDSASTFWEGGNGSHWKRLAEDRCLQPGTRLHWVHVEGKAPGTGTAEALRAGQALEAQARNGKKQRVAVGAANVVNPYSENEHVGRRTSDSEGVSKPRKIRQGQFSRFDQKCRNTQKTQHHVKLVVCWVCLEW